MSKIRDISTLDLAENASAEIFTNVWVGDVFVARVKVTVMVLEAQDGRVNLMVDQDTQLMDGVRLTDRSRKGVRAIAEDPG